MSNFSRWSRSAHFRYEILSYFFNKDLSFFKTPPSPHWSTCHNFLIGPFNSDAFQSAEVGETTEFTSTCDVLAGETYRIKAQIECNFDKISESLEDAHVLSVTPSFRVRTGYDSSGYWYQIFLDQPWTASKQIVSFGDDIRSGDSIFFHEGDCSEGGFMEFVVDQVHLERDKTKAY
jgi:hypothetical protein